MQFADIHIHALYGVDDGAKTKEDMFAIIDAAYADGTRLICMTPHFYPAMFGRRHKQAKESFRDAEEYVLEKYPDLCAALAHMGFYSDQIERATAYMEKCPNLMMDMTPAPIIYEQLSETPDKTKEFIYKYFRKS